MIKSPYICPSRELADKRNSQNQRNQPQSGLCRHSLAQKHQNSPCLQPLILTSMFGGPKPVQQMQFAHWVVKFQNSAHTFGQRTMGVSPNRIQTGVAKALWPCLASQAWGSFTTWGMLQRAVAGRVCWKWLASGLGCWASPCPFRGSLAGKARNPQN